MIKIYFSPTIYKSANKLIEHAKVNLIKRDTYPKIYCNTKMGIITFLREGDIYPMHSDNKGGMNKVTFLNNNGGMKFEELDVKAFTGLTMEFKTEESHQPYTDKGDRWALLQRYEKS